MAEETCEERVKFTLVHGAKKYPVELPGGESLDGPTVDDLANLASKLTEVPRDSQRLIFKGQSLTDFSKPLKALGIKKGSKVMLIGKKFDPLEEENMKVILTSEQRTNEIEKRLTENIEEISGIEKGFLQSELVDQALERLKKKLIGVNEEFMKLLESLDALVVDPSLQQARGKKKSLIQRIQLLLDKTDGATSKIESLQTKQ